MAKECFLYLVRGRVIDKEFLTNEASNHANYICDDTDTAHFSSHIDMFAADGTIVVGWLASQTDMLANDWGIS